MARKSKAQIKAESHAQEVANTVSEAVQALITKNYASIVASAKEHNSWTGAPISLRFNVTEDGIVRDVKLGIPRKAVRDSFIPESPSDKIQERMDFTSDDEDNA